MSSMVSLKMQLRVGFRPTRFPSSDISASLGRDTLQLLHVTSMWKEVTPNHRRGRQATLFRKSGVSVIGYICDARVLLVPCGSRWMSRDFGRSYVELKYQTAV